MVCIYSKTDEYLTSPTHAGTVITDILPEPLTLGAVIRGGGMSNVIRRCTVSQFRTSGIDPDMYIAQAARGAIWSTPGFGLVYGLVRCDRRNGSPLFRFTQFLRKALL